MKTTGRFSRGTGFHRRRPVALSPSRCEGCGPGRIGFLWRAREPHCLSQPFCDKRSGSRARHRNPIRPRPAALAMAAVNATGRYPSANLPVVFVAWINVDPLKTAAPVLLAVRAGFDGDDLQSLEQRNRCRASLDVRRSSRRIACGSMRRVGSTRSGFARSPSMGSIEQNSQVAGGSTASGSSLELCPVRRN